MDAAAVDLLTVNIQHPVSFVFQEFDHLRPAIGIHPIFAQTAAVTGYAYIRLRDRFSQFCHGHPGRRIRIPDIHPQNVGSVMVQRTLTVVHRGIAVFRIIHPDPHGIDGVGLHLPPFCIGNEMDLRIFLPEQFCHIFRHTDIQITPVFLPEGIHTGEPCDTVPHGPHRNMNDHFFAVTIKFPMHHFAVRKRDLDAVTQEITPFGYKIFPALHHLVRHDKTGIQIGDLQSVFLRHKARRELHPQTVAEIIPDAAIEIFCGIFRDPHFLKDPPQFLLKILFRIVYTQFYVPPCYYFLLCQHSVSVDNSGIGKTGGAMAGYINNRRTSVSREEFLAAIPESNGQLEPIEMKLNCTRNALRDVIARFPELEQELKDELERQKDRIIIAMIEDSLYGEAKEKNKARETLLRAIARDRGFGERLEVSGPEGQPLVFLHTAAQMLPRDKWVHRAELYAEKEDAAIEEKIAELGIGGTKRLPGGK